MLEPTIVELMAAAPPGGGSQGNLVLGLVMGAVAVVAAISWFAHRYRAARGHARRARNAA